MEDKNQAGTYTIKKARLETGFVYEGEEIVGTDTALFNIKVQEGIIQAVEPYVDTVDGLDAEGRLVLPAFRDMHIHLDKTLFGLPWQAHSPTRTTVKEMIAYEQEVIPELLKTSTERAGQLIDLLQQYGTGFARTHFNVDPTSGLKLLEHLERALVRKKGGFSAERVAFPQHGLYYTATAPLMKEAAALDSVDFIGGLDPFSIDGSVERPLDFTLQLALDNNKGIDIHLHDLAEPGVRAMLYLADKVEKEPGLQGRTFISHAFALAHLAPREVEAIASRLAGAGVGIVTSVPFGGQVMPIPLLKKHGVTVLAGNDNVQDHWSTFGSGNMLQKANLIAQLYGYVTELELSRSLGFATEGVLPLSDSGERQWPKAGDAADMVWVEASCSAEAVARIAPIRSLFHKGMQVF